MGGIKKGAACGRGASYLQKTRDTLHAYPWFVYLVRQRGLEPPRAHAH